MSRTIAVSAGDRDYVWFRATEKFGEDVTGDQVVVGFSLLHKVRPTAAIQLTGQSDLVEHPSLSVIRAGLFVAADAGSDGAHVMTPGRYWGWIKPIDAPAESWVECGPVDII